MRGKNSYYAKKIFFCEYIKKWKIIIFNSFRNAILVENSILITTKPRSCDIYSIAKIIPIILALILIFLNLSRNIYI